MFDPYVKIEDVKEAIANMNIPESVDETAFYKVIGEVFYILNTLPFVRW